MWARMGVGGLGNHGDPKPTPIDIAFVLEA